MTGAPFFCKLADLLIHLIYNRHCASKMEQVAYILIISVVTPAVIAGDTIANLYPEGLTNAMVDATHAHQNNEDSPRHDVIAAGELDDKLKAALSYLMVHDVDYAAVTVSMLADTLHVDEATLIDKDVSVSCFMDNLVDKNLTVFHEAVVRKPVNPDELIRPFILFCIAQARAIRLLRWANLTDKLSQTVAAWLANMMIVDLDDRVKPLTLTYYNNYLMTMAQDIAVAMDHHRPNPLGLIAQYSKSFIENTGNCRGLLT